MVDIYVSGFSRSNICIRAVYKLRRQRRNTKVGDERRGCIKVVEQWRLPCMRPAIRVFYSVSVYQCGCVGASVCVLGYTPLRINVRECFFRRRKIRRVITYAPAGTAKTIDDAVTANVRQIIMYIIYIMYR